MSNTHGQLKLMDYYVQNFEEFKENFHIRDTLHEDCEIISIDDSSQYFKFTTSFHPTRFVPNKTKSSPLSSVTRPTFSFEVRNPLAPPQVEYGKKYNITYQM